MKKQSWVTIAFGLCATFFLPAYVSATNKPPPPTPECNRNLEQTGAEFVTIDSGAGSLSCSKIFGPFGKMHEVDVKKKCGDHGCKVTAKYDSKPFDAVVIGTNGQSCVYMFKDALAAKRLEGPHNSFRFACSDGGVTEDELPDEPITSVEGGCVADIGDFDWAFTVGNNVDENDKTGLCVQGGAGGANGLARCDEQCIVPTDTAEYPYDPTNEICSTGYFDNPHFPDGSFPLSCRPCALKQEVAPPDGSKSYCWELSHQRAAIVEDGIDFKNFFIPPKTKSMGSLRYISYEGSTCYQVSTTYRGRQYSYWTPSGCP